MAYNFIVLVQFQLSLKKKALKTHCTLPAHSTKQHTD